MDTTNDNYLKSLNDSDYEVSDNEPNIIGWKVKDQQNRTIGEVDDLIFDSETRRVRYIVLDLEGNVLDLEPRDVLVPIGIAELHASDDDVLLPGVTADHLRALPVYESGNLVRATETAVVNVFSGVGGANAGSDFYQQEHFDEDRAYKNRPAGAGKAVPVIKEEMQVGKKEVETGGARLRTRIVEKPVQEKVNLREEHVSVERKPVNRPVTDSDIKAFKEGEIEITEHAEVPVVGKEARVVEEVKLEKEVNEREETIKDTVRSTEVKVDQKNPDPNAPGARPNPNDPDKPRT